MNESRNIRNFDLICMMIVTYSYHSNKVVAYFCKVINRIELAIVTCNYMLSTLLNDTVVYVSVVVVLASPCIIFFIISFYVLPTATSTTFSTTTVSRCINLYNNIR